MADYLPALRFRALTPAFDAVVRLTSRETAFKEALLVQAAVAPGQRVLDLGCGTGTLAILVKQRQPEAQVLGLDADAEILELAQRKADRAGIEIEFARGLADQLPAADASYDRVVSTLFFHHLASATKQAVLGEIARVLKPGGQLHVADWTEPADPLQAALSWQVRLFDGRKPTEENFTGQLPKLIAGAGLSDVRETRLLRTPLGTIGLISARR
jgi:ubiquinone/menaquinone biosynthesis C-methylase UbiE